jgi:hypothetical protein
MGSKLPIVEEMAVGGLEKLLAGRKKKRFLNDRELTPP